MKILITAILVMSYIFIASASVITGVVIDANDSMPISKVKISSDSINIAYSNSDGKFKLEINDTVKSEGAIAYLIFEKSGYIMAARSIFYCQNNPTIEMFSDPALSPLTQKANNHGDSVLTPIGYLHFSKVHKIEHGHSVDFKDIEMLEKDASGRVIKNLGLQNKNETFKKIPLASGWITSTWWQNSSTNSTTRFSTVWAVPPAPETRNGQTVFLFNGMENSAGTDILQPVLQWDNGLGNFWTVGSWYVTPDGTAFYSSFIQVNSGDILTGVITQTGVSGSNYSYNCQFQGIANTSWNQSNIGRLEWHVEALEFYAGDATSQVCSEYPRADYTLFSGIDITVTGNTKPVITWSPQEEQTDCGQHVKIITNANPMGAVGLSNYNDHFVFVDQKNTSCTSFNWYKGELNSTGTISTSSTNQGTYPQNGPIRTAMSHVTGVVATISTGTGATLRLGKMKYNGDVGWCWPQGVSPLAGADEICLSDYNDIVVFYSNSLGNLSYSCGVINPTTFWVTWNTLNAQVTLMNGSPIPVTPGGNFLSAAIGGINGDRIALFNYETNSDLCNRNMFFSRTTHTVIADNNFFENMPHGNLISIDVSYDRMGRQTYIQNEYNNTAKDVWVWSRLDQGRKNGPIKLPNRTCGRVGTFNGRSVVFSKATNLTGILTSLDPSTLIILNELTLGSCPRISSDATRCDIAF